MSIFLLFACYCIWKLISSTRIRAITSAAASGRFPTGSTSARTPGDNARILAGSIRLCDVIFSASSRSLVPEADGCQITLAVSAELLFGKEKKRIQEKFRKTGQDWYSHSCLPKAGFLWSGKSFLFDYLFLTRWEWESSKTLVRGGADQNIIGRGSFACYGKPLR